jgi:hypothetical protein
MRLLLALLVASLLVPDVTSQGQTNQVPKVPDAETAVRIAEAMLIQNFGKNIKSERPFTASLTEDTWLVTGSDHCGAPHCFGAPAAVKLSKQDGHVIAVYGPQK